MVHRLGLGRDVKKHVLEQQRASTVSLLVTEGGDRDMGNLVPDMSAHNCSPSDAVAMATQWQEGYVIATIKYGESVKAL